ncbi:hypothetical protein GIB67_027321 [Kingdonia uniflora]|uniref:Aminotransferase-like plant mobile domain-containing protein n=1 Tax=Kingdonia uniflora TaxID=39325 RepID=A0A7J7P219_9MAGN|nr:hypothetical protein GIB67_027321 [Kingdonia uniflora]
MDIRLGNSDNRLIQALTEHWWPTTHMFLFPCVEIGDTPLNFTMLISLSISRYSTQVPYDDAWSVLSNVRQLLPNIDSSYIKSGNISISHLSTYLTIAADREDNITIARDFIFFMMGHLWFQTANDTVPLGYLVVVADLDQVTQYDWGSAILAFLYHGLDTAVTTGYWFYEYCGVGHPIVKEEVKFSAYPRLRVWERGNRRKTNDQATNLFIMGRSHIDNRTIEMITWEPWLDSVVSEIEDVLTAKFLSRKERETYASYWAEQTSEVGYLLTDSQRMRNIDLFGPTVLRAGITPVVVMPASVHRLSQDFSLPGDPKGQDPGWHME